MLEPHQQRPHLHRALQLAALVLCAVGCSRNHYRVTADRDVGQIVQTSDACSRWDLPDDWAVYPDARSRFFDPTNPNAPRLPIPAPQLNAYRLPPLASGLPERNRSAADEAGDQTPGPPEEVPPTLAAPAGEGAGACIPLPPVHSATPDRAIQFASATAAPPPANAVGEPSDEVLPAPQADGENGGAATDDETASELRIAPVPPEAWGAIPDDCLIRMLEFESVREEYRRTYGTLDRGAVEASESPRLTLENIVELALINNRDYQQRKDALYRVALRLSAEQYEYELNPVPFGNGTDLDYRHLRSGGQTINTLAINSAVAVQKTTRTAGQFLARFANDVVLTFNGPQGFAADVGSELLFDFQQTIFQRDIVFEQLTQSQRDVIYAARNLIRFRKQLFRDVAGRYYNLLLVYRGVEINAQDYFSNLRGFLQARAEYVQSGRIPRIQVDQFEQNALASRSQLVGGCNDLESNLDQLKLLAGLPPEMPLNLELRELEEITLGDEATVAGELVSRTNRLLQSRDETRQPEALLGSAGVLADRIQNIIRITSQLEQTAAGESEDPLQSEILQRLQTATERIRLLSSISVSQAERQLLDEQAAADIPQPFQVLIRTLDVIEAQMTTLDVALAMQVEPRPGLRQQARRFEQQFASLAERLELDATVEQEDRITELIEQIPGMLEEARMLLASVDQTVEQALLTTKGIDIQGTPFPQLVRSAVDEILGISDEVLSGDSGGLPPIDISGDAAMLTALVQRLDLANVRGDLADAWRQIKLAGDDLRSILDLQATQVIRTRSDINSPFAFSFDDSETRLRASLDTPLNRRLQRNAFRLSLINYNAALRNLIDAEDAIKFDVREDLRRLALDREQYKIAVASAALAYERVVSTRLQLRLGLGAVAARDFLEAQQAYTASLSNVARRHIAYTVDRIELYFDLESLETDELGFWPGLRDEDLQPPVNLDFPGTNPRPYGRLPQYPIYSREIRSMECIPPGQATVHNPEEL